ncbi:MAG: protease modulator HflC [Planctomycetota bacterium]|nr:protease modulator HflC [Planctomycetota bacterium]
MRTFIRFLVAGVFLLALFAFACTYTVRFTEAGVLTMFGRAGEDAVKREPGLYFKWPYPIESVTKYDTRVRTLTLKLETQQTADAKQVAVEAFCSWRVNDPLKFFRKFSNAGERPEDHYRKAEDSLSTAMRSALGVVSKYTMDDLFTTGAEGSQLSELEAQILAGLRSPEDKSNVDLSELGVEVASVGLMRVVLPEETTKAVFERMKGSRDRLAKEIESRGEAEAQAIRAKAESDAKKIREFAQSLANELRARGEREATPFYAMMSERPELAVFLSATDYLRSSTAKRTTLVVSEEVPGLNLLFPSASRAAQAGTIPSVLVPLPRVPAGAAPVEEAPKANLPAVLEGSK